MKMKWLVFPALVAAASGFAQEIIAPATADVETPQPINFQVLRTKEIKLENRSIILNRVVAPVLPAPPPPPPPPTAEEIAVAKVAATEAALNYQAKKHELLFFSATVYDGRVTEVSWFDNQHEYKVFSSINFNHLAGLGWFETADTEYMLLMGVGEQTSEQVAIFNQRVSEEGWPQLRREIPPPESFTQNRAEYFVVEDENHPAPTPAQLQALDDLHVYYDANKPRLIEEHTQREAARLVREREFRENPPVPKNSVINYWFGEGGKGTRVLDKKSLGGRP